MKKICIFPILFLASWNSLSAQDITGRLTDREKNLIPYANVVLLSLPDSAFVAGGVSDTKGIFSVRANASGNYLLNISCIGYETLPVTLNDVTGKVRLGDLILQETVNALDEVQVTASNISRKIDRQVVLPSSAQLQASTSGYDLLGKLMLPGIVVNPVQQSVSTHGGGAVELRINDRKATQAQVLALPVTDVVRVEYIDNPGVRYGDTSTEAVINYIVKRKQAGVAGGLWGNNAVATGFGNDNVYVSVNTGKSEFGVDYYVSYRDYDHRYSDESHRFLLPDGTWRERELKGMDVPFGYTQQNIEASYNLTDPDKYVFNVLFKNELFDTSRQDHAFTIFEKDRNPVISYTHATDKSHAPSLDLYYQCTLPRQQKLSVNAVGTYRSSDYSRDYREYTDPENPLARYAYATDGDRYSLIGEAIYQKEWSDLILSVGVKGSTAYTRNAYTGHTDETLRLHDSSLYGYAEVQGKVKRLNYNVGLGVSRQAFSQSADGYSFVTLRPSVSLSYPVFRDASLRYTFSLVPHTPSLSQLSEVEKQLTDIEQTCGNSGLSPYRSYQNRLVFSWNRKNFSLQWNGNYTYHRRPIMQQVERTEGADGHPLFVYRMDNQKSYRQAGSSLNLHWKVIPSFLSVGGYGGVNWFRTEGELFRHNYTSWYGGLNATAEYDRLSLSLGFSTRYNSLYGEMISYGENNSYAQLIYRLKRLKLGVSCLYPFQPKGWSAGSRLESSLVKQKSWSYIKDNGNMVCLYFSWTFNYGRKHQSGQKSLNNADGESGIVK